MKIKENERVNDLFEKWMGITDEPSFNQTDMNRLRELAICMVEENFLLSDDDFVQRVKLKFRISRKNHRGDAQKFLKIIKEDINFYRYLRDKHALI